MLLVLPPYHHARPLPLRATINKNEHSCSGDFYFAATNVKLITDLIQIRSYLL
jgi:hypothetical protein